MSNQRIEAYWSQLRKSCTGWLMNFFKDLNEAGIYDTTKYIHSECMKFVSSTLVQRELDVICDTWNSHRIRNTNLDGQMSFILNIVITFYIQLITKTLSCYITICNKAILVSHTRVRQSFLNWQIFWWMKII